MIQWFGFFVQKPGSFQRERERAPEGCSHEGREEFICNRALVGELVIAHTNFETIYEGLLCDTKTQFISPFFTYKFNYLTSFKFMKPDKFFGTWCICFILIYAHLRVFSPLQEKWENISLIQLNVLHVRICSKCTTILMIIVKINKPNYI